MIIVKSYEQASSFGKWGQACDSHLPQAFQDLDDAFDLVGAFLVFAAEVLGELFGVLLPTGRVLFIKSSP